MKKLIVLALVVSGIIACNKGDSLPEGGGTVSLDLPETPFKYFAFGDDSLDHRATLGRVLFYENRLSLNNAVACASCHKQAFAFSDNVARSRGFENRLTGRNSMAIQNLGFDGFVVNPGGTFGSFFWDGRENDLKKLISRPISNHVEMGIEDLSVIPEKLEQLSFYRPLFEKAYGSSDITIDRISDALALFLTSIQSTNTRFDQDGSSGASLSALEQHGNVLFNTKYNCASCHKLFVGGYSGSEFMNIGLEYPNTDRGAGAISNDPAMNGRFKIPNLRNVGVTAPYMHDGRFSTLDEVLEHYSHGIQDDPNLDTRLKTISGEPMEMDIPASERKAIIAFLNTLTDYQMLTEEKYANPFKIK